MQWLIVLVLVVLVVPAWAWLMQERMIFFPQLAGSTAHLGANATALEILTADGARLRGWIVKGAAAPSPTVIYYGGNAEEVSWTLAEPGWPRDWSIVSLNYRGYGTSEGKPGERALSADALAIYDAVARRGDVDRSRIVVFGRSLGSALAAHVAARRAVSAAVLVSPYDSMIALGKLHYPWLPVSLLLRHRFDAIPDAKRSEAALLAIVGERDSIIPPERSRALYDAWRGPKQWLAMPGARHNDLGAGAAFWQAVAQFLAAR